MLARSSLRPSRPVISVSYGPAAMRIAIVAECFTPAVNGVTNSVIRLIEHARQRGHEVRVIAPGPGPDRHDDVEVVRVASVGLAGYRDVRIALPYIPVQRELRRFAPDVVYAAAPVVLGAAGLLAARHLGIPRIAVFQTDLAGFARRYHLSALDRPVWSWLSRVHRLADLTLAPSTAALWMLRHHGVSTVERWGRGVDLERFHPRHASIAWRRRLAPRGEVLVGYVGRLAREKQIHRLLPVTRLDGVRVVIVGDGPVRGHLEKQMPEAEFLGLRTGTDLSQLHATFDIFAHTGIDETFCQSVQESLASATAVVAPAQGGPLDLVRHLDNGMLWSPGVEASLTGAIAELVHDPVLRGELALRARSSVLDRSWNAVMDELFEDHLPALITPRRRSSRLRRVSWRHESDAA